MSSDFYTREAASAQRQLESKGRPWTFTRTDVAGVVTSRSAVGAFIKTVRNDLGNSGVAIGDKQYIFSSSATPQNGDRMTNANTGESYVVTWFDPIGDTPAAFWVWGRTG
jgi:hypothetical protein